MARRRPRVAEVGWDWRLPSSGIAAISSGLSCMYRRRGKEIMKRVGVLVAVALMAASILSGCVIVPAGGWHGGGWYHHRPDYAYPYGYRYPYRRGW